ncbi:MAG: hypothetical protein HP494_00220 [Nitrospira sp.]|nr:hypothetical protein [Nitrospira sp.]
MTMEGWGQRLQAEERGHIVERGIVLILSAVLLVGLVSSPAWSESPAPSVHWGSTAFPDQYSTVTTGLTLNRFTPIDGLGNKYDSTVGNTLGFNLITLSWTQHWGGKFEGWSTNLTTGVSPTSDEPSQLFSERSHSPTAAVAVGSHCGSS